MRFAIEQGRGRYLAAAGSALVALAYVLIGFGFIAVVDDQAGIVPPMVIAGVLFAALAVLLALSGSRWIFGAGAALLTLVLVGYVAIAPERSPTYEAQGVLLKVLQALLLGLFVYLAVRQPRTGTGRVDERALSSP